MRAVSSKSHFVWIQLSMLMLALAFSYWEIISSLVQQWLNNEDFSHGLLIAPISVYLAWERRKLIDYKKLRADWRALPILLMAIGLYVVGELGAEMFTIRVSLILFFIGAIWLLYGMHLIKLFIFPLLFLFLMLPLPGFIYRNLTFPLQILSSKWAVAVLNLAGVLAYREGNVIDLGFTRLQVVEACNGLRFILPLFTLGVLFAFWSYKPLWKRLILIFATIPIAITANILRIGGTGILAKYFGEEAAQGFFHSFSGWVVFMISFTLFFGLNRLLKFLPGRVAVSPMKKSEMTTASEKNSRTTEKLSISTYAPFAVLLVLVLAAPATVNWLGNVAPQQLIRSLDQFPLQINGRMGESRTMDPEMWENVGGQAYFLADYSRQGDMPINLYVAYYEYQRKSGDFIHSPRLCLPGAGWFIDLNRTRTIGAAGEKEFPGSLQINELIIRKGNAAQLVYFWYQGRDRNFTSEYAAKFWMVWDGIWRRRTDGALVRTVVPIHSEKNIDEIRDSVDRFALTAAGILDQDFLP